VALIAVGAVVFVKLRARATAGDVDSPGPSRGGPGGARAVHAPAASTTTGTSHDNITVMWKLETGGQV
jgi:hypothetical protein